MRIFATLTLLVFVVALPASAAITGFEYAGEITSMITDRYGGSFTIFPPTPVFGRVLYDNESLASDAPSCYAGTCLGYRQHIRDGMAAKFGDLVITADDYVVEVRNNNENHDVIDALHFVARPEAYSPNLPSQLKVNGIPRDNAWYQLVLTGSQDAFPDTSLPAAVDFSQFSPYLGIFDGDPGVSMDVLFRLLSISPLALPGDYDRDHNVSGSDYELWRSSFSDVTVLGADGSGNHIVDAADYVVWRASQSVGDPSKAVPEPYTFHALIALVLSSVAIRFRLLKTGGIA